MLPFITSRGHTLYQNVHYTDCLFVVSCCALLAEFLDFGGFRTHPPNSGIFKMMKSSGRKGSNLNQKMIQYKKPSRLYLIPTPKYYQHNKEPSSEMSKTKYYISMYIYILQTWKGHLQHEVSMVPSSKHHRSEKDLESLWLQLGNALLDGWIVPEIAGVFNSCFWFP